MVDLFTGYVKWSDGKGILWEYSGDVHGDSMRFKGKSWELMGIFFADFMAFMGREWDI